ncbi:MAG: hypothetical protein KDC84_15070, partial [Crocinitomicaceae bacterium]|nr:hypothetical protein [Crocinitomicaceae bacterium]
MKNILSITFAAIFLFSLNSYSQQPPKKDGWDLLGSRVVNWGIDKDVIAVGPNPGGYTKLKIKVTGGAVNMHRMVVTYGNGEKD